MDGTAMGTELVGAAGTDRRLGLAERAKELRKDAIATVVRARDEVRAEKGRLEAAKTELLEAVRVATSVGVSKETLSDAAGVSASTIGAWVRGEKDGSRPSPDGDTA